MSSFNHMIKPSRYPVRLYAWYLFWGVVVTLGLVLGLWQWERADDKRELLASRAAAPVMIEPTDTPVEGAQVHLRGRYLSEHTLYLDNRMTGGRLGVAVLTPLRDRYGQLWLVQRGFLETGPSREAPSTSTPVGMIDVDQVPTNNGRTTCRCPMTDLKSGRSKRVYLRIADLREKGRECDKIYDFFTDLIEPLPTEVNGTRGRHT